jgi:hypothetical protein
LCVSHDEPERGIAVGILPKQPREAKLIGAHDRRMSIEEAPEQAAATLRVSDHEETCSRFCEEVGRVPTRPGDRRTARQPGDLLTRR